MLRFTGQSHHFTIFDGSCMIWHLCVLYISLYDPYPLHTSMCEHTYELSLYRRPKVLFSHCVCLIWERKIVEILAQKKMNENKKRSQIIFFYFMMGVDVKAWHIKIWTYTQHTSKKNPKASISSKIFY